MPPLAMPAHPCCGSAFDHSVHYHSSLLDRKVAWMDWPIILKRPANADKVRTCESLGAENKAFVVIFKQSSTDY
jgi:hypothetical protein